MPGPLYHSAATVLQYLLVSKGHGSLPIDGEGWPTYVGNEPDGPDEVITLYSRNIYHRGKDHRGEVSEYYGVDIRVRSCDYALGDYKILSIKNFLDKVARVQVVVPGLVSVGEIIPEASYQVNNFSRANTSRGTQQYLHLGKERQKNSGTDIVFVSQREIFTFSGKVNLRML